LKVLDLLVCNCFEEFFSAIPRQTRDGGAQESEFDINQFNAVILGGNFKHTYEVSTEFGIVSKANHFPALPGAEFSVSFAGVWPLIPSAISSPPSTGRAS
jgi:hypothetical protein